jgi:hypothetical protein
VTESERRRAARRELPDRRGAERREELEAWWALVARILAFFLGSFVLVVALLSDGDSLVKLGFGAIGVGLMGPVIASTVAQVLLTVRGGGGGGGGAGD